MGTTYESQCAVTCDVGFIGTATATCNNTGDDFVLNGCEVALSFETADGSICADGLRTINDEATCKLAATDLERPWKYSGSFAGVHFGCLSSSGNVYFNSKKGGPTNFNFPSICIKACVDSNCATCPISSDTCAACKDGYIVAADGKACEVALVVKGL